MKIVNVVLSILILVLALASAVFSYFLYEKRTQFIDGWNQLTASIYQNSAVLDKESGTSVAQGLSKKSLAHVNYSALKKHLPAFLAQSTAVMAQRDQMADILYRIGSKVGASIGDKSEFTKISSYNSQIDTVNTAVADVIRNRDNNYSKLVDIAGDNGISINAESLKNADGQALNNLRSGMKASRQAKENYRDGLRNIAARVGAQTSISDDGSSSSDANAVLSAVDTKVREIETVAQKLDSANNTISSLNKKLEQNQDKLDTVSKALVDKNSQIANYKRVLGIDEKTEVVFWKDGSKEARAHLCGKVVEVSDDYGYIVINLGTKSTVTQQIGKKSLAVNLSLVPGVELTVVRGKKNPDFIAAITLDKVGDNESTANIPAKGGKIKVGDMVLAK